MTTQSYLFSFLTDEIGADFPVDILRRFLLSATTKQKVAMAVGDAHVLLLFAKGFLPVAESLFHG